VGGSDGTRFTVDSGDRAAIPISGNQTASDPDIFAGPNGYVLYISRGQGVQVLASATLRGTYGNVPGLPQGMLTNFAGGIPSGHYDSASGKYWTYVASNQTGSMQVIRQAIHDRIDMPLADSAFATILSGSTFPGLGASYTVGSPGFAVYDTPLAPQCTLTASPGMIAAGGSATLTATCDPAAVSYAWTNSGFTATTSAGSVSPTVTTTYFLIGGNAAGSGNTASATVTVTSPAFISQSDCLFNWAERNYPDLFAPAGAMSNALAPYYYRHYPQTETYLATSAADNYVYYLGPLSNNSIIDVGALSPWLSTAGCQ
jgi:hypothetical protein